MFAERLLPGAPQLRLLTLTTDSTTVVLTATPAQASAECPLCLQASIHVHSRYTRRLADLPWAGRPACLLLQVRKFFCRNPGCRRAIFTERLPRITAPWARRTTRLAEQQRYVGLAPGGEPGMRTLHRLAMPTSSSTLLRLIRRRPSTQAQTPRILGVDDWAWRKRATYGTLLVNLERHRPIELLEDRTAETLARWLRQHPGVEVISRDRASAYADGATRGAPRALQVADRFHLVQNLREALERLMDRNQASLRAVTLSSPGTDTEINPAPAAEGACQSMGNCEPASEPTATLPPSRKQQLSLVRRSRRKALYEQVRSLHALGVSQRAIARHLGISRKRVCRFVAAEQFPERAQPRPQARLLDVHQPYLIRRWEEGCTNVSQLWRELGAQGFTGCRSVVSQWALEHRRSQPAAPRNERSGPRCPPGPRRGRPPGARRSPPPVRSLSARQASWLLVRTREDLTPEEQDTLERLQQHCADAAVAYPLTQAFTEMVCQRAPERYGRWITAVRASGLKELSNFVLGLERDDAAVRAALALPWSNGQTEGQITKLKLIKRQMNGRAKFDLLRERLLAASPGAPVHQKCG